jgi:hypothetical protein
MSRQLLQQRYSCDDACNNMCQSDSLYRGFFLRYATLAQNTTPQTAAALSVKGTIMFIPIWMIITIAVILLWSVALNFLREKQITALKYSFINLSDTAINMLNLIKDERENYDGDVELMPVEIIESIQEFDQKVGFLLELQGKSGVKHNPSRDGAKALGIV